MAWYHTFFHGLPQEAWRAAQSAEQTQLELELIVDTLSFGPGDEVLDIFCGYGRHALPLARMGANVTGIDISEEYIKSLQTDSHYERLPLTAICADFMSTPAVDALSGQFDAAYCLGNSFAFFPYDDMGLFLKRIANLLQPGGRLLVQSGMVAEVLLPDFQERSWMPISDGIRVLMENQYNPIESCINQQLTYLKTEADGSTTTEQRTAHYYVYTIAELERIMRQAGLTVEGIYGTVDQQPFMIGDESVWIVASM